MELNHILLFMAVASSLLVVLRSWHGRNTQMRSSAAAVLLLAAIAWLIVPSLAGWVAAIIWIALLLVPANAKRRQLTAGDSFPRRRAIDLALSPAVVVLAFTNMVAFAIEILGGGPTNASTLSRLGWLDTDAVIYGHQIWRILTAPFLHYGLLHLFFNVFALLVLGPPLERQIGAARFTSCYLLSGIGSGVAVVLLTRVRLLAPVELVGASGCIMGVVGAWAAFLLRHRHLLLARQRLRNVIVIVLLQVAFDLVTPRVSMSAHIGGLVTGFLIGLALPLQNRPRHVIRYR